MSQASSGSAIPLILFAAFFVGVILVSYLMRRRETANIRQGFGLAGAIDVQTDALDKVHGTIRGRLLSYVVYQGSKHTPASTTAITYVPPGAPTLEMYLREQSRSDTSLVARALEVDVRVGNAIFDQRVVVEAAPAETACVLLDEATQSNVLAMLVSTTEISITSGQIRFHRKAKITDPQAVAAVLSLLAQLADRLTAIGAEIEARAAQAVHERSPIYRGASPLDIDLDRRAREQRAQAELAALHEVRSRRGKRGNAAAMVFGAIFFVVWLGIVLSKVSSPRSGPRSSSTVAYATTATTTASPVKGTPAFHVSMEIDHRAYDFVHAFVVHSSSPVGNPRVVVTTDPAASCESPAGATSMSSTSCRRDPRARSSPVKPP